MPMPTAVLKALTTALPLLSNTIPSSSQAFIHHRIAAAAPSRSLHAAHNIPNAIMSYEKSIANHAESLSSRLIEATAPSAEEAVDILNALETETTAANNSNNKSNTTMTIAILESTKIGKLLTKTIKTCKRHKRGSDESSIWDTAIQTAQRLIDTYKQSADEEAARKQKQTKASSSAEIMTTGLPTSASTYRQRLLSQKKELYKDPPVLPPSKVIIESEYVTTKPKRSKSGELSFAAGQDSKNFIPIELQRRYYAPEPSGGRIIVPLFRVLPIYAILRRRYCNLRSDPSGSRDYHPTCFRRLLTTYKSTNTRQNAVDHWVCGSPPVGSRMSIRTVGFNGIVDSTWEDDVQMMHGRYRVGRSWLENEGGLRVNCVIKSWPRGDYGRVKM